MIMKVCFLLQRRFAYIGHDLAVHLKNRHGITDFCGFAVTRPSYRFLMSQKEIDYSALLLDEDLHLQAKKEKLDLEYIKYLEKEYGLPNLWPYIEVDRILRFNQLVREYPMDTPVYSHEDYMKMVQVRAKAIIEMLEKQRPDYLICSAIGGTGHLLLYHIAKKMGVKVLMIMPTKTGTRYLLSESFTSFTEVDKEFDQLKQSGQRVDNYEEAKKFLEDFRSKPKSYAKMIDFYLKRASWIKQFDFITPGKLKRYFKWLFGVISNYFKYPDKNDYSYVHLLPKIKDQVVRKFRNLRGVEDLYDKIDPENEDYVFFPLHLEPEITLLLYAARYTDQVHVIKQIARSLPMHYKIYVKDHPRMVGFRKRSYYKELKKIPNLKLVDPKVKSPGLMKHSKLVTVITGSAGWEALMLKKPVVSLGGVFFNKLSMTKRCDSYEKLSDVIKDQLENFEYNEEELINYLGLILRHTVEIDLRHLWHRESDKEKKRRELIPLADLIAKHIKS